MLTQLTMNNFKNFKEATLALGPFSLLVGANASAKSNVRDALRFLHGVERGYSLAEILGEKYGEGGERQWRGVRGGTKESCYTGTETFSIVCEYYTFFPEFGDLDTTVPLNFNYQIDISIRNNRYTLKIKNENLYFEDVLVQRESNNRRKK